MSEATFNLREFVREVAESVSDPSPHAVAEAVLDKIADGDLRAALGQVLPDTCRRWLAPRMHGSETSIESAAPNKSRKSAVAAWVMGLEARLQSRVNVGTAKAPQWKFLGDCGRDDLIYAAGIRRRLADENASAAAFYEAIAEELARHRQATVRALVAIAQ